MDVKRVNQACSGSVLLLTLLMIVLMAFEVALVSLVVLRGLGDEGVLASQNIAARRAAETAINQLAVQLHTALSTNTLDTVKTQYVLGGSAQTAYNNQVLQVTNPTTGTTGGSDPPIYTSAWVDNSDSRGYYFHLVGRARYGTVDLLVHQWRYIKSCNSGELTTIVDNANKPGYQNLAVDSQGRVFFGQGGGSVGKLWTWDESTGLSTLVRNGSNNIGLSSLRAVSPVDNRVFFTGLNDGVGTWTWHKSTGLSLIGAFQKSGDLGGPALAHVGPQGRAYWGAHYGQGVYTWKESTGLSLISDHTTDATYNGHMVTPDDRVAFMIGCCRYVTWKEGVGLSTIIGNSSAGPGTGASVGSDGRLFVGSYDGGPLWTWKDGVLSTVVSYLNRGASSWLFGENTTTKRVLFGAEIGSGLWSWDAGTGLSTIQNNALGWDSHLLVRSDGRAFYQSNGGFNTWALSTGVSVIHASLDYPGVDNMAVDAGSGRVFFGERKASNAKFYVWHEGSGLSLIGGAFRYPNTTVVDPNGRAYWGTDTGNANGALYSWFLSTGLTTVLSGLRDPGNLAIAPSPLGGVFFGQDFNGGNFYYWKASNCSP